MKQAIQNQMYLTGPHGQLFLAEGILYNREQEELEEKKNPLGAIGKMFQIKLEEDNPEVAEQEKFEGIFYSNAKIKENQVLDRIDNLYMKLLDESLAPEIGLERIQHFQQLFSQAQEIILAEYQ